MEFKRRRFPNLEIKEEEITGTYKGRYFNIFLYKKGNAYYKADEKRYNVDVQDIKSGMYDVMSYQEFNNITEALKYAVEGAML